MVWKDPIHNRTVHSNSANAALADTAFGQGQHGSNGAANHFSAYTQTCVVLSLEFIPQEIFLYPIKAKEHIVIGSGVFVCGRCTIANTDESCSARGTKSRDDSVLLLRAAGQDRAWWQVYQDGRRWLCGMEDTKSTQYMAMKRDGLWSSRGVKD